MNSMISLDSLLLYVVVISSVRSVLTSLSQTNKLILSLFTCSC